MLQCLITVDIMTYSVGRNICNIDIFEQNITKVNNSDDRSVFGIGTTPTEKTQLKAIALRQAFVF